MSGSKTADMNWTLARGLVYLACRNPLGQDIIPQDDGGKRLQPRVQRGEDEFASRGHGAPVFRAVGTQSGSFCRCILE